MPGAESYPCVVVGLGAMGSAALYQLTRRGVPALGIEQFPLGHSRGSSHGQSRVFRTAYEDPLYSRLSGEALELWRALEADAGEDLLQLTGLLGLAHADNERMANMIACLQSCELPVEVLTGREVERRFDQFALGSDAYAFLTERDGFLRADRCLQAMRDLAQARGATILDNTPVQRIEPGGTTGEEGGVVLHLADRQIHAERVICTAGPWVGRLLDEVTIPLKITREQKVYFAVDQPERFRAGRMPVFLDFDAGIYGLPILGDKILDDSGLKISGDHFGRNVDPDDVDRTVDAAYIAEMAEWIDRRLPAANPRLLDATVCLYSCTPDLDFILDRLPQSDSIVVAGGFSGHGFKFSILVGDIVADLAMDGETTRPIDRFRCDRDAAGAA